MRKPFFRPTKNRWYVELDGKHVNLGADEAVAWARYHQIMADRAKPKPQLPQSAPNGHPFVSDVINAFVHWLKARVAEGSKARRTLEWYHKYLTSFVRFLRSLEGPQGQDPDDPPALTVDRLEPIHVYSWVDNQPGWKTGRRGAMTAVQRAFSFAAKAGLLKSIGSHSPIAALEKPAQGRRELLVSERDYREVLGLVRDDEFRDLLELSWETGCRPHELFTVEAAYVDLQTGRWVFPVRLSKGKKVQRVVFLTDRALVITRRLVLKRPAGPLLLNTKGTPWCVSSAKCRFQVICRQLGRQRLQVAGEMPERLPRMNAVQRADPVLRSQHEAAVEERRRRVNRLADQKGLRLNLYAFRHSRITESLVNGLDAVTVSILAGHRDTTMISRHYAHLTQRHEHMRKAANRATGA